MTKLLQTHLQPQSELVDVLHKSKAWRSLHGEGGMFDEDQRALSLGFCTDGLNPFAHHSISYSMWPITLTLLNLPRKLRMKFGSLLLVGIIPGPSEPKSIDTYLVDDLIKISGSEILGAYKGENFILKQDIVLHILDYPGQNKVFRCHGE